MRKYLLPSLIIAWTLAFPARAWPPTFGGEIEFTNREIDKANYEFSDGTSRISDENADFQDLFADKVKERCNGCTVRAFYDHDGVFTYRVKYSDGWWFNISLDPNVIEVQTAPSTVEQLKRNKGRMQTDIFDAAKAVGLRAGASDSGGHIHMGASSAFDDDAKLFRNFIVDFANHAELASGVLDKDYANAPPIAALSKEQRLAFAQVIQEFDAGKRKTIQDLVEGIQGGVYFKTLEKAWIPPQKYHAMNITRVWETLLFRPAQRTVEIRSLKGQRSASEFIKEAELFQGRLNYLKALKDPVPYIQTTPPKSRQAMVNQFYRYVAESGLSWEDYAGLMPKNLQRLVPTIQVTPLEEVRALAERMSAPGVGDGGGPYQAVSEEVSSTFSGSKIGCINHFLKRTPKLDNVQ